MATLKDIAAHVGISVSAVSLALRDHTSIGKETKRKVWEAKKKLGYELRSKSSGNIAFVLLDRGFDFIYARAFQSIGELAMCHDQQPIYLTLSHASVALGELPIVLQNRKVDGIIVSGVYDEAAHRTLKQLGLPLVVLGNYQPGEEQWASCEVDLMEGMRAIMRKLTEFGHRRVGLLTCTEDRRVFGHQLRQFYSSAIAEFEVESVGVGCERDYQDSDGRTAMQKAAENLLSRRNPPTAIIAERANLSVYDECARLGFSIPGDLSIVSLGTVKGEIRPSLATLESDPAEMGRGAFEKLQRMIENPDPLITRELFTMRLVEGDSLGRAKADLREG